ncbi:hypothetical protein [Kingella negevensis]|uniref:hypothetical protein n=1 Tax=Kingella negevensis TaxID=1522312 RepID=UPI00117B83E5|nr:hypothetical protein [Kingella negevensis]WII91778.1 hypothetical protein QEO93_04115 [Kingella negevensis]
MLIWILKYWKMIAYALACAGCLIALNVLVYRHGKAQYGCGACRLLDCVECVGLSARQGAIRLWSVQAVHLYHDCKARHGALVKAVE